MKPSDSRLKKAEEQFQSATLECRAAMEPHLDKMEANEGKFHLAHISTVSIAVLKGAVPPAELASVIELVSAKSGIPKEALEAYARFTTAMINATEIRHQNKSPR